MRQSLAYLRESNKIIKGTIDGWALIHVALAAVRELAADSWVHSFNKVNLKPSTRVSFPDWIKRIEHYVQGGESFKLEVVRDPYTLLSSFWHGMAPDEKSNAMSIFVSHEKAFTVACVKDLSSKIHIPMPEMQNVRVGIELALLDPSHLERGRPGFSTLEHPAEVQKVQSKVASVVAGLSSFQLHPKADDGTPLLSGLDLFDHLHQTGAPLSADGQGTRAKQDAQRGVHAAATEAHQSEARGLRHARDCEARTRHRR